MTKPRLKLVPSKPACTGCFYFNGTCDLWCIQAQGWTNSVSEQPCFRREGKTFYQIFKEVTNEPAPT